MNLGSGRRDSSFGYAQDRTLLRMTTAVVVLTSRDGQGTRTDTLFSDTENGTHFQCLSVLSQNKVKEANYVGSSHIRKSEDDNTGEVCATGRHEIAKIQIVCEDNSLFDFGLGKNLWIRQGMQIFLNQMNRVISHLSQIRYCFGRDAHVCQEFHTAREGTG